MTHISRNVAVLVLTLLAAFWSSAPSRAVDDCALVTGAELEAAFGVPFPPGTDANDPKTSSCFYIVDATFNPAAIIGNSRLPPGSDLVTWRAQYRAGIEQGCRLEPDIKGRATFQIVPGLGEEAFACRVEMPTDANPVDGITTLHAAKGPNFFFIFVPRHEPDTLEKLSTLARKALTRLPQ
jgi:hypothetical protein